MLLLLHKTLNGSRNIQSFTLIVPNWLNEAYLPELICYKERNISFCNLNGVWGDDFHKKFQILEKNFILFYYI